MDFCIYLNSGANWKDLDAEIVLNLQGSVIRDIVFQAVREENSAEFLQVSVLFKYACISILMVCCHHYPDHNQ